MKVGALFVPTVTLSYDTRAFFIFMPRYTACGILVPEQGLNLGPGGGNVET